MPHFMLLYFIKFSETRKLYPQPFCWVFLRLLAHELNFVCLCAQSIWTYNEAAIELAAAVFIKRLQKHACHKFRDENKLLAKKTSFIVPTILKRSWILLVVLKSPWIRSRSLKSCNLVVTSIEFVRNLLSP